MLHHTFANRYLRANPDDVRGLARLLGHANLNTVMIYTEPDLDDLARRLRVRQSAQPQRLCKPSSCHLPFAPNEACLFGELIRFAGQQRL